MAAGEARDIAVGWDPEFESATFDTDEIGDDELATVIFEELDSRDPDWRSHLRLVE